jgi:surface antigen
MDGSGRIDRRGLSGLLLLAAVLAALGLAAPLRAAEPGPDASARAAPAAGATCEAQRDRSRRRGRLVGALIGGLAGGIAGGGFGRNPGRTAALIGALAPVGALLGDAIAGLLDCDEQRRAASATEAAVSRGVGTTENWASATRPGVTGSSTVTAAERTADGGDCMIVTDIVIVDGEETRAPKRLCRSPPSNRYARV